MFEEKNFKAAYREAYERIIPDEECIRRLADGEETRHVIFPAIMRPAVTGFVVLFLLTAVSLPAAAKANPKVYNVIAKYVPVLADYLLPQEYSSTSSGIVMQVEAIKVEGKTAEILISFSDEDGQGNYIDGPAELMSSFELKSYGAASNIGGCRFLEYDQEEDKAYFKVDVTAPQEFNNEKLTFMVSRLLTDCREEVQWIDLSDVVWNPEMKETALNGRGGSPDSATDFARYFGRGGDDDPRPTALVMDIQKKDSAMKEQLTVTGIGYEDGVLRVQICRGNLDNADRHMQLFLVDSEGEERHNDYSVYWNEKTEEGKLSFEEFWFAVEESELENLRMYGILYITDGCVKGDWEVTFKVE